MIHEIRICVADQVLICCYNLLKYLVHETLLPITIGILQGVQFIHHGWLLCCGVAVLVVKSTIVVCDTSPCSTSA